MARCLKHGETAMLLTVAESIGSSPGRAGYKMAVAAGGEMNGSIGGGVMEVKLVEHCRATLSEPGAIATGSSTLVEQVHQKNSSNPSGMICSGKQTVILRQLTSDDADVVSQIVESLHQKRSITFEISNSKFQIAESSDDGSRYFFSKTHETDFVYRERLGSENSLYIIGGGHCALALSELAAKLDFRIHIYDDRPELNTIEKNHFADEISIIESYEKIGEYIDDDPNTFVVVMTLGFASDAAVIRQLVDRDFKYFGVLGSNAKMSTLMKELRIEGIDQLRLSRIRTPIGLPINSRTPEE
ncbi:MAG: XdhC family protein, partial [Pyrinomonadaceae bacterium]